MVLAPVRMVWRLRRQKQIKSCGFIQCLDRDEEKKKFKKAKENEK